MSPRDMDFTAGIVCGVVLTISIAGLCVAFYEIPRAIGLWLCDHFNHGWTYIDYENCQSVLLFRSCPRCHRSEYFSDDWRHPGWKLTHERG